MYGTQGDGTSPCDLFLSTACSAGFGKISKNKCDYHEIVASNQHVTAAVVIKNSTNTGIAAIAAAEYAG